MNRYIEGLVNIEQLLQVALFCSSKLPESEPIREISDKVIIGYIIGEFDRTGKAEFSEEDISDEYGKIMADFTLTNMVKDGLLDVVLEDNGSFSYGLTDKGNRAADNDFKS